jgi:hypothetical protein
VSCGFPKFVSAQFGFGPIKPRQRATVVGMPCFFTSSAPIPSEIICRNKTWITEPLASGLIEQQRWFMKARQK